jgi:enamine deaminase RidA (YjgF/YER057c/UK114 family)
MSKFKAIEPSVYPWYKYSDYTFSLGLATETDAFISGHTASTFNAETGRMIVVGGMTDQVNTAYDKIECILEAAGMTFADITRVVENVTVSGLPHYAEAQAVRIARFNGHTPTITTVMVDALLRPEAFIEIEVYTTKGGGKKLLSGDDFNWARNTVTEGHDGSVFLPTLLPIDKDGNVVHEGDFVAQYRYCLERGGELLSQVGLSLDNAVTTYDYSMPETRTIYGKTSRVRKELLGGAGVFPGAGGILMSQLHKPGVLVAIDLVASHHPLKGVNPGWKRYDTLSYTPGVIAGKTLYMSGFASLDMETQEATHAGDIVAQAQSTYEAILLVLNEAGVGPEALVNTIEYVVPKGLKEYRGVAKVRENLLTKPWPSSTGALCHSLLRPEFLLEVFPLAVLP